MPWAYSHDAKSREHGSGDAIADQYRKEGVIMTPTHAQFETGGYSVQASIMDMVQRLEDDRLKIFSTCPELIEEMRLYHSDSKLQPVRINDDAISAARYGLMMLRYAKQLGRLGASKNPAPDRFKLHEPAKAIPGCVTSPASLSHLSAMLSASERSQIPCARCCRRHAA